MKFELTVILCLFILTSCLNGKKSEDTYTNSNVFSVVNLKADSIGVVKENEDSNLIKCWFEVTGKIKNISNQTYKDCYV
jgi:hypothetical protein